MIPVTHWHVILLRTEHISESAKVLRFHFRRDAIECAECNALGNVEFCHIHVVPYVIS